MLGVLMLLRSLIAAAAILTATPALAEVIQTQSGPVSSVTAEGVVSFKGIPFAAPPVGDLRWRAPRPARPWTKTLAADHTGPACPQHVPPSWGADPRQAEDCLYLNIWRPAGATPAAKLPVMVWIYGGAFVIGDSASKIYDGSNLARDGVIVVNFNYRLGRLGWFATPELTKEAGKYGTGDFGLMDQIAALKWVRANIAAFGGDPNNVTIFGESAGGMSVNLLMTSPAARGLFAKAITESGLGRIPAKPLAAAEAQGVAFAKAVGAKDVAALRALPVDAILSGPMSSVESGDNPGPIVDGELVPENVDRAFSEGKQAPVPWMVGTNDYEASLFPGMLANPDGTVLAQVPAEARPMFMALFDPDKTGSKQTVVANVLTDKVFAEPARYLAARQTALGQPAYRYVFAYVPQNQRAETPGAGHGAEIQFVFGTLGTFHGAATHYTDADRKVSADMGRYWTNFAKTGDPNGEGLTPWPMDKADQVLLIDQTGEHAESRYHKPRLDLLGARAAP